MNKEKLAVIFGGESSEHEVSCISVRTIINNVDTDKYDMVLIGITEDGKWLLTDSIDNIIDGTWRDSKKSAMILPDKSVHGMLVIDEENSTYNIEKIDVVFPVLHGLNGEDGTIQGLFELAGISYVGCGVLASSTGMDKLSTKKVVEPLGIRQAKYVPVFYGEEYLFEMYAKAIEDEFPYPVFVKPSNAGSSKGVSKACNREELKTAIEEAAKHDNRILVEEMICGREVECAVLGSGAGKVEATGVGEILAAADFYDFDAKYNNAESKTVIDPDLDKNVKELIRGSAIAIFKALNGFGLSRVDFFVENETNEIVFNEINTMPGFTEISMYPMLWEACGLDKKNLVNKLIEMAKER